MVFWSVDVGEKTVDIVCLRGLGGTLCVPSSRVVDRCCPGFGRLLLDAGMRVLMAMIVDSGDGLT